MARIEDQVQNLLESIIVELGYELYDVIYAKEGKDYYLRIFIDQEDGIGIEDCEKVNEAINDILDEKDLIPDSYFLEVSSPGLERLLRKEKHFLKNLGKEVTIKLYRPVNKKREFAGILKSFENNKIALEVEKEILEFELKDTVSVNTVFNFEGGI
ncbi:MAG: ribosome maturation factor RimP [Clostridia bacterium]|nr:ribosome maturation factor RimP [Clostridia bacterium]